MIRSLAPTSLPKWRSVAFGIVCLILAAACSLGLSEDAIPRSVLPYVPEVLLRPHPIVVLLTIQEGIYQAWQSRVFVHHARHVGLRNVVAIVAARNATKYLAELNCSATYQPCPVMVTPDEGDTVPGDSYGVYNRALSIQAWLKETRKRQHSGLDCHISTVVVMEPDMIPIKPVTTPVAIGAPVGHDYFYMHEDFYDGVTNNTELMRRCSANRVQPVGPPFIIHIDDLERILPLWISMTREIRALERNPARRSWIADMWGYACAAAELGIVHTANPSLAPEPPADAEVTSESIALHYTYPLKVAGDSPGDLWSFNKRTFLENGRFVVPYPRPLRPPPSSAGPLVARLVDAISAGLVAAYGTTNESAV